MTDSASTVSYSPFRHVSNHVTQLFQPRIQELRALQGGQSKRLKLGIHQPETILPLINPSTRGPVLKRIVRGLTKQLGRPIDIELEIEEFCQKTTLHVEVKVS